MQQKIDLQSKAEAFFAVWGLADLSHCLDIKFSKQLRSTLGRTRIDLYRVRINTILTDASEELLDEVICHELAHIAVYKLYGATARPHGKEWRELLRRAGFRPRLKAEIDDDRTLKDQRRYEHICPICQVVRYAKRPMTQWRCATCIDACLGGKLVIRRIGTE